MKEDKRFEYWKKGNRFDDLIKLDNSSDLNKPAKGLNLVTSDIAGASNNPSNPSNFNTIKRLRQNGIVSDRNNLNVNDIMGSKAKQLIVRKDGENYNYMTRDVDGKKKVLNKGINPLDPQYIQRTESGRKQIVGAIDNNKPKILIKP
jgi:hypothetical protein